MNDKVEAPKQRVSDGEFRHYVFGLSELRTETESFLRRAGYELKPSKFIGLVQPDFRAKRKAGNNSFELAGMIREKMEEALDALIKLAAIKAANKDVDCVLVLPPINEYLLIEWLTEEKGRWYFGTKDSRLMIWFCNPDDHTMICVIGTAADRDMAKHFYMSRMSFDEYIAVRHQDFIRDRILAEEEED
ncbi:MAG: hypothetical protein QUS33_03920 [Dehalococcoidia bacterium]|nr:hypothetical protein [Dehalococcoidia bacterium]